MSQNPDVDRWPDLKTLVAISLLQSGSTTLAARHAKALWEEPMLGRPNWLRLIAGRLWPDASEQQRQIQDARVGAERALSTSTRLGFRPVSWLDDDYPALLREIPDPPVLLWTRGIAATLQHPSVAIVGSRDALPASLAVARQLAGGLAEAGLTVVSGLALGVDGAAHAGALAGGGPSTAVLGSGLNHIYPALHVPLAEQVAETGAVVSEYPPDARPYPSHFPLRNRIISGLCRATVVVEASERSGSLITARLALDQNRNVLAVPGGPLSGRHRGCHALIKDGARLVETVGDVLDELNWARPAAKSEAEPHKQLQLSDLEANMAKGEAFSIDELAGRTGRSASELLADLSVLELARRLVRTPDGRFVRIAGPELGAGN
jgi:DNA processing protein